MVISHGLHMHYIDRFPQGSGTDDVHNRLVVRRIAQHCANTESSRQAGMAIQHVPCPMAKTMSPAPLTASAMRMHSSALVASGFSQRMWYPTGVHAKRT